MSSAVGGNASICSLEPNGSSLNASGACDAVIPSSAGISDGLAVSEF